MDIIGIILENPIGYYKIEQLVPEIQASKRYNYLILDEETSLSEFDKFKN